MAKVKSREETAGEDEINFDIDPANIKNEYTKIPSYIATLNSAYAQAKRNVILAKHNRDKVFAQVYDECVAEAEDRGDKKPTEAALKNKVTQDPRFAEAVAAYARAEGKSAHTFGRAQAMIAKKEMVVSLGAHVRQELDQAGGHNSEEDPDEDDEG